MKLERSLRIMAVMELLFQANFRTIKNEKTEIPLVWVLLFLLGLFRVSGIEALPQVLKFLA